MQSETAKLPKGQSYPLKPMALEAAMASANINIDLHLIRVMFTLISERSVSRAAMRLRPKRVPAIAARRDVRAQGYARRAYKDVSTAFPDSIM